MRVRRGETPRKTTLPPSPAKVEGGSRFAKAKRVHNNTRHKDRGTNEDGLHDLNCKNQMKSTTTVIMNEVSDTSILRAKRNASERKAAAIDGYQKAKKIKSIRRGERRMIEEDLELAESVMTDEAIDQWNATQELKLDRSVGFGTPVLG